MVRTGRVELPFPCGSQILSLVRLPIPPRSRRAVFRLRITATAAAPPLLVFLRLVLAGVVRNMARWAVVALAIVLLASHGAALRHRRAGFRIAPVVGCVVGNHQSATPWYL